MLVDSHCHLDRLDLIAFDGNLTSALEFAAQNDVGYFLCVGIDIPTFPQVLAVAEKYPNVFASVGIHPTEDESHKITTDELIKLANHPKVVAIGETGLDFYRDDTKKDLQKERFRQHIQASIQTGKALIVHSRQARQDTIQVLKEEGADKVGGVLHCFTEDWEMAKQAIDLNFYISFSGIVTFQNAKELREVAKLVPLDRILIETDSPYLAPVPFRGKPNQPAYVRYVAQQIADLRDISYETVAEHTTTNFFKLFHKARL